MTCVVNCIKDKVYNILAQDENIKDRWMRYFDELFNGDHENIVRDTIITPIEEN